MSLEQEYAELMRGNDLKGGGLETHYKAWQHIEGLSRVTSDGDTARSLSFYFHVHDARDVKLNLIDAGYWHDDWMRTRCHGSMTVNLAMNRGAAEDPAVPMR